MHPMTASGVPRRTVLKALGVAAGAAALPVLTRPTATAQDLPGTAGHRAPGPITVDAWRAAATEPLYIAHRGSGDVLPEHSMVAYQAAADWGATVMEISVGITADGVLICMHDATYDRTTNGTGSVLEQPSSVLQTIRIWQPRLGAAWTDDPPPVPLFEDVLKAFGGSIILCVEAKIRQAYQPMMAMVEKYGLKDSVIVKLHYTSSSRELAVAAGYPLFSYLGSPGEATLPNIALLGAQLDPKRDVLVIPAGLGPPNKPYLSDELVTAAVDTGVPTWVFALHRRSEAQHFFDLGVRGAITSSFGYLVGATTPVTRDSWAERRISAGEITRSADDDKYAPTFTTSGRLELAAKNMQHFVLLGQFSPVPAAGGSYNLDVDVCWTEKPTFEDDNVSLAFGRTDDRYYQHRQGVGTGYHTTLRANGFLGLYLHRDGRTTGQQLAGIQTPPLVPGVWTHLRVAVTPSFVTVKRTDTGHGVSALDTTVRGGFVHLGRGSTTGVAAFRDFVVS